MPQQISDTPVGLPDILVKARKLITLPALSNSFLGAIQKRINELPRNATKEQVAEALAYIQGIKKKISNPKTRAIVQEFIVNPLLTSIGREIQREPEKRDVAIKQVGELSDEQKAEEKSIQDLRKYYPKEKGPGGINTRGMIFATLDSIIQKLAALNQPLSIRPDYDSGQGTTGDMAERLKKIKEQVKKDAIMDAMMIKNIPPMQDYDESPQPVSPETPCMEDYDEGPQPNAPKIVVIDDYDEDEQPQIVKQGPPCCPECGQELPAQMGREAHCLDHKFRAIKNTLKKSDLSESQLKIIHGNLDEIYKKYRQLEKETEGD
jgi:hypothetical protein